MFPGFGLLMLLVLSNTMYCAAGPPGLLVKNVSVLAARDASMVTVASTVAPPGTLAMAASSARTCWLIVYVCGCHRCLSGAQKASPAAIASMSPGLYRTVAAARLRRGCPGVLGAAWIRDSASMAAMKMIGIRGAL